MLRPQPSRNGNRTFPQGRSLHFFDDPARHPQSFGCSVCADRNVCGGLHVASAAFDCLGYCCGGQDDCDSVCPRNVAGFVARTREIAGFGLDNVGRAPRHSRPELPRLVPMVFHGSGRERRFAPPAVALKLYGLFDRSTGEVRFRDRAALARAFCIAPTTRLIVSGVEIDRPLERWWSLGYDVRQRILDCLVRYGVEAVTSPNYSLFSNTPRWDDLHSMKRIAICWQEMAAAGLRAALHVNARTTYDWRRWRDFIGERSEVNTIAFEFAVCGNDPGRRLWYAEQLARLADEVRRPLTLISRGGLNMLSVLKEGFTDVTFIDTTPFHKAVKRQLARPGPNGEVRWKSVAGGETSVEELLDHNYLESVAFLARTYPERPSRDGRAEPVQAGRR